MSSAGSRVDSRDTLAAYLRGNGLDASPTPVLDGMQHAAPAIDNAYTLRSFARPESLDFVYADAINATKFHCILLQEWLFACRTGGHVVVSLRSNDLLNFAALEREAVRLAQGRAEIVHRETLPQGGRLVLRKVRPSLAPGDSMAAWTFGIVTNGKRNDWVERQIASIRALGIPALEIIVCGTYFDRAEPGFRYLDFRERDELGWITRKKNLICEAASHENLVVVHDKMLFDPGWFTGMQRFGNHFEVLGCTIRDTEGERAGDWVTLGNRWDGLAKTAELEYRDWDRHGFLIGALYILKRSVWRSVPWDESLYWNQKEDIRLARQLWERGFVTRFNPHSSVEMLHRRFGRLPIHEFDPRRLGRRRRAGVYYLYMTLGRAVKKYLLRR